jgi:hypothetical protein
MRGWWLLLLLIPTWCVAESQLAPPPLRGKPPQATARLDFRIIIPATLSLQLKDGVLLVSSNHRSLLYSGPAQGEPRIINAAHQHVIQERLSCGKFPGRTLICTVSTP